MFIAAYGKSSFHPATEDAREVLAIGAIVDWLVPRIGELASLPRHLIHGDWTPPNIKVLPQGWGVLDWEFSRIDPAVMDLAQSCITILIWSGLDSPAEHIARLVETYSAHSGRDVSVDSVRTAMAVYWLQNYSHWRARQETVGGFEDVISALRESEGESLSEFAERLGVSRTHLSDIEHGRRAVSLERAARFATALGQRQAQFVRLALQDQVRDAGLKLKVDVHAA